MAQTNQIKKRVLIVCQHYWPEAFRINDISDFLVHDKNCDVEVLCGLPNYPKGKLYEGYSVFRNKKQVYNGTIIRRAIEIPRGPNTNIRIFLNYISFPLASIFHIPRLLAGKYDKILLYQLSPVMMSFAGIVTGRIKKIETTMYVLDLWPENLFSVLKVKSRILRNIITIISHWHYRHVDKLVVLSDKMKGKLLEITDLPEDKIVVLPQACEKIYEKDILDEALLERFEDGFNILYAGNLSPAQSFSTIINAAELLRSRGFKNIRWIVVGDGMSRKEIEEEVKERGLHDSFVFEGFKPITDIPKYTHVANLLIGCLVKSDLLEATIPAKVMSYLAAGKPVVLAMDGEVQKLVNDDIKCGMAGPTENFEVLADNIEYIYKLSPEDRARMGDNAREYHFKHFERDIILNRLYDFMFMQ